MVEGLVEGGFLGDIPAQEAGTTIYYYVSAMSNSGKQGARPMPRLQAGGRSRCWPKPTA